MRPRNALPPAPGAGTQTPSLPHASPALEAVWKLGGDPDAGLTDAAAAASLARTGLNLTTRPTRPRYGAIALRQWLDPLVGLLVAAAAVSFGIGDRLEAGVIAAIVVVNAVLGFVQELGSERAVLALRESLVRRASVVRAGRTRQLRFDEIVPGDLVLLHEGDRVPADARVIRAQGLEVEESALTGESLPIPKSPNPVPADTPLAERSSMVYAGTAVTRGRASAVVTATGDATEMGLIATLAGAARRPPTPLERRLGRLGRRLVLAGAALTVALAAAMVAHGAAFDEAFLVGISVAVAAVPEGLAAAMTIALALGARSMAHRGAIVRSLEAIETIGETTVICCDKTGTLTENRLTVAAVLPAHGISADEVVAAALLASPAELVDGRDETRIVGDPVEAAILLAARERGISRGALLDGRRLVREIPFDPARRRVAVVYEDHGLHSVVKGAPEVLLERSCLDTDARERLEEAVSAWAADGLRVLAVAERRLLDRPDARDEELERELTVLGLLALHNPLRPDARDAIAAARSAHIDVRMLTGDHPATARAIARELGLPEDAVHARVTPADKLALVERLQAAGEVVAVTGDGINDAPALRQADVGVAMGLSGTEAAREASDIVLTDDRFATIVAAVQEGRRIGDNVRSFVAFLLSANLGEVLLFAVAVVGGFGAPMTVVQVLVVNLLTDGLPAVALSRDPASADTLTRSPRRDEELLPARLRLVLGGAGAAGGVAALGAFFAGRALGGGVAQTMAFVTIALAQLAFVFSCRDSSRPAFRGPRNGLLVAGVAASAGLLSLSVYAPGLNDPLGTVPLGLREAAIAAALALVPFAVAEASKRVRRDPPLTS